MGKLCINLNQDLENKIAKLREATGITDKSDVIRLAVSELYKKYYGDK